MRLPSLVRPRSNPRIPALQLSLPGSLAAAVVPWAERLFIAFLLLITIVFSGLQPVNADAGRFLAGSDYAELSAELASLQRDPAAAQASLTAAQQQRLADLQVLERLIARSDDRAQLRNRSTHNLGLFARSKKDPADQAPAFYVLAPGHSSDDDFDLVALLIPSGVSLRWGEGGETPAISTGSRVVRVLEGQQLEVRDPAAPANGDEASVQLPSGSASVDGASGKPTRVESLTYELSQPPFQVLGRWEPQPSLPDLNQAALDRELETAPLD